MAMIGRWLAALALFFAAPALFAQHGDQPMHHQFGGAEHWSKVFDDPARDAWQKPAEVVRALGLAPDAVVADVGSGTGYFSVRLARAVPRGRVYGADIEPDMVRFLERRAAHEGLANLKSVRAAADAPNLPERADLVLLVDTVHHIAHRSRYFAGLKTSLKPGGRVAIIDFRRDSPTGPPPQHRVAPDAIVAEMAQAGYRLLARHDFLPYQYFLVFGPG
jgi:predicted methyltransferase